jgi:DoxX-like protein
MRPTSSSTHDTTRQRWAGRIVTALPVLFLIFDLSIKLAHIQPVTDAFANLGVPDNLAVAIGALELLCLVVYLIPQTAVLGAILCTGYLGGAIMLHVRIGNPLFSHVLFPVYIGGLLWIGLYLRDPRVRALIFLPAGRHAIAP